MQKSRWILLALRVLSNSSFLAIHKIEAVHKILLQLYDLYNNIKSLNGMSSIYV